MFSIWQAIDADGNKIETWRGPKKSALVGTTMNGSVVASIEPYEEPVTASVTRSNVFAATLDKMNPVWYNSFNRRSKNTTCFMASRMVGLSVNKHGADNRCFGYFLNVSLL